MAITIVWMNCGHRMECNTEIKMGVLLLHARAEIEVTKMMSEGKRTQ